MDNDAILNKQVMQDYMAILSEYISKGNLNNNDLLKFLDPCYNLLTCMNLQVKANITYRSIPCLQCSKKINVDDQNTYRLPCHPRH